MNSNKNVKGMELKATRKARNILIVELYNYKNYYK